VNNESNRDLAIRLAAADTAVEEALSLYDRAQQLLIDQHRIIGGFAGQYTPEYFPHLAPLKAAVEDAIKMRSKLRAETQRFNHTLGD
jgi:hypothetical protein